MAGWESSQGTESKHLLGHSLEWFTLKSQYCLMTRLPAKENHTNAAELKKFRKERERESAPRGTIIGLFQSTFLTQLLPLNRFPDEPPPSRSPWPPPPRLSPTPHYRPQAACVFCVCMYVNIVFRPEFPREIKASLPPLPVRSSVLPAPQGCRVSNVIFRDPETGNAWSWKACT